MSLSYLNFACAVCFGDPNSLSTQGVLMGVVFLLGTVLCVLIAIGATAFVWAKRAKDLQGSA